MAFIASVVTIGGVTRLALTNVREVRSSVSWSEHSQDVLLAVERTRRRNLQASSEARRPLFSRRTGEPPLDAREYDGLVAKLRHELAALQALVSDNPRQESLARDVAAAMERYVEAQSALLRGKQREAEAAASLERVEAMRVESRELLVVFGEEEQRL